MTKELTGPEMAARLCALCILAAQAEGAERKIQDVRWHIDLLAVMGRLRQRDELLAALRQIVDDFHPDKKSEEALALAEIRDCAAAAIAKAESNAEGTTRC